VAARVLLFADRLTAAEAAHLGLVAKVVEPGALMGAALDLANRAGRVAPLAVRAMKTLVAQAGDRTLAEGLDREHEALFWLYETEDAHEGIAAFTEKRQAAFEGR
jgi:enoyl-CoA hydratase/carnithine racemase